MANEHPDLLQCTSCGQTGISTVALLCPNCGSNNLHLVPAIVNAPPSPVKVPLKPYGELSADEQAYVHLAINVVIVDLMDFFEESNTPPRMTMMVCAIYSEMCQRVQDGGEPGLEEIGKRVAELWDRYVAPMASSEKGVVA